LFVLGGVVVEELGVAEVAPLELPEVVESLAEFEVELGFVPLSAERWQPMIPNARIVTRNTVSTVDFNLSAFIFCERSVNYLVSGFRLQ
jgi:hypothetical protein